MEIFCNNPYNLDIDKINHSLQILNSKLSLNLETLSLEIITDEDLLIINNEYLNHNYYTDIITFDLRDDDSKEASIYISYDRVKENASLYSVTPDEELFRVCIHGMLHLSGKKDKTSKEKKEMRELENKYLDLLFHVKQ